ncbi:hypothetical protein F5X96DRAFT_457950 [Biscogniauxia mediterranea]|nr:hypothetical protein F5X96DRAFT_457950 [Biscogniauxia mediterranea]
MANGFEKLEKFFGGSRRKEKMRRRVSQQRKLAAVPHQTYSRSSPIFPSPSYLRPMSMHMMPREAQVDGYEKEKGRSQSVPNAQDETRRCSSIASSITAVDNAHICSERDPSRSMSRRNKKARDLQSTPVQSHFRFPEDSLFRHGEPGRTSGETTIRGTPSEASPCSGRTVQSTTEKGLLDWTPKHISLLFDPLDLNMSFDQHEKSTDTAAESLLLPSPMFATPAKPVTENDSRRHDISLLHPPPRLPEDISTQISTVFPRKQSLFSLFDTPHVNSPSSSDDGGDTPTLSLKRSVSLSPLSSPHIDFTPRTSIETTLSSDIEAINIKNSVRETWGNRSQDPNVPSYSPTTSDTTSRSPLVRNSASIATLSLSTTGFLQENTLREPTFDDFYALSDDDIAESRPATPSPAMCIPPTPPPKDSPVRHENKGLRQQTPISPTTRNPTSILTTGEITPPCTPTDPQFLPMTCSPPTPRDTLGAIRAAELAAKYNFAVVYVVSLWPEERRDSLGPSRCSAPQCGVYKPHDQNASPHYRHSKIISRLLAAYGLTGIPSPFRMVTDISINALNHNTWSEHRNPAPGPYDITHGWIRSYHTDYVPVSSPIEPTSASAGNNRMNRGIVFAAYVKKTSNSVVPLETSPEKNAILEKLDADAKALIDTLVDSPSTQ